MCDLVLLDEFGHGQFGVWLEGRAIVEDESCARSKGRDEPVPHHPRRCCVEKDTRARGDGTVKYVFFFVLEKRTQRGVNDAFGCSGCT